MWRRKQINFGHDFCGDKSCNICFADENEEEDRAYFEWLDAELQAFNTFREYRAERKREKEPIKTDGNMDFLNILMGVEHENHGHSRSK